MSKPMFDIESDNFQLYFEKQMAGITESGREAIPKSLYGYLFAYDGSLKLHNTRKLGFVGRLWILWRCLKKRVWVVVENEESGMGVEEFVEMRKAIQRRDFGVPKAEGFATQAMFITGNRELCDTFQYLNGLSSSGAYNYLLRYKNFRHTKTSENVKELNYIIRFIRHYEAHKKKWVQDKGITVPEWYVLLFLYDKGPTPGSEIYLKTFAKAYHSSQVRIRRAFSTLQTRGWIVKHGQWASSKMEITALGRDVVNSIINTYIINC